MRRAAIVAVLWALCIVVYAIANLREGRAQMSGTPDAISFFLNRPPTNSELAGLPNTARDVLVAKVRLIGPISSLRSRDQSGLPPSGPPPKDLFGARIEVLDVLSGPIKAGVQLYAVFGEPGAGRNYVFPVTPHTQERPYFVASFIGQDEVRRLAGFHVSQGEYEEWQKEWLEHERMRGRPGARD